MHTKMASDSLWPLSQGKFYLNISKMHFSKKMTKPSYREAVTSHLWSSQSCPKKTLSDLIWFCESCFGPDWTRIFQRSCPIVNLLQQMHVRYLLLTERVTEKQCFWSTTHASQNQNHIIAQLLKLRHQGLMFSFLLISYTSFSFQETNIQYK